MCLAVPGQLINITGDDELSRRGQVRFGEAIREASLAFVPEAAAGDYLLVHAGIAISVVSEEEAQRSLEYLRELE